MRIAVFIKSTTFNQDYGGLETQNKLLCEGLAEAGHGVVVVAPVPGGFSKTSAGKTRPDKSGRLGNAEVREPVLAPGKPGGVKRPCGKNPPKEKPVPINRDGWGIGRVEDSAGVEYIFIDSSTGKYSRKWFRESVRVFKELHNEEPFDAVISQSMAGQGVVGYIKSGKVASFSSRSPFSGVAQFIARFFRRRLKSATTDVVAKFTLRKEARFTLRKEARFTLRKEEAEQAPQLQKKERGLPSTPIIVIQHGTILGELKTRWKALWANSKSETLNSKQISMTKIQNSKWQSVKGLGHLKIWILKLPAPCRRFTGFRISDLGFRIFTTLKELSFFIFRLIPYGLKTYIQDQIRLRRADAIIAVSDLVKDSLVREYFLPGEKVEVVYNGIDIDKFEIRKESETASNNSERKGEAGRGPAATEDTNVAAPHGAPNVERGMNSPESASLEKLHEWEKEKVLLYVGRIEKEKGLSILLRAFQRADKLSSCPAARLLLVGSGRYANNLVYESAELGIAGRVIFAGKVPYEDVPKYYVAADVFVLPSLRQEGLPMTLPEAMASGLPVVASRIGGIPNAVEDDKTGFLVEPGSVEELSEALVKLLENDQLSERMGENARGLAKAKFSQEAMVERTLAVIRNIAGS